MNDNKIQVSKTIALNVYTTTEQLKIDNLQASISRC